MPTSKLIHVETALAITSDYSKTVPININGLPAGVSTVHINIASVTGSGTLQARIKGSLIKDVDGVQLHTDVEGQTIEVGNIILTIASPFEFLTIELELGTFTGGTISVSIEGAV